MFDGKVTMARQEKKCIFAKTGNEPRRRAHNLTADFACQSRALDLGQGMIGSETFCCS